MKPGILAVCVLAAALASGRGAALEIEGVVLGEWVALERGGPELVLNGAGVRHKLLTGPVYVAALYLGARKTSAEEVLADPGPKRIALHVVAEQLGAKELIASLDDAISANHIPAEIALFEKRLRALKRALGAAGPFGRGAVVLFDFLPQRGTRVTVNDEERLSVAGEDLFRALLRVWIGRKPVDGRLRDALLGGAGPHPR